MSFLFSHISSVAFMQKIFSACIMISHLIVLLFIKTFYAFDFAKIVKIVLFPAYLVLYKFSLTFYLALIFIHPLIYNVNTNVCFSFILNIVNQEYSFLPNVLFFQKLKVLCAFSSFAVCLLRFALYRLCFAVIPELRSLMKTVITDSYLTVITNLQPFLQFWMFFK